jgi:hypothetical protein
MDPTRLVEQTKELFVINNENNKYVNLPSLVSATNQWLDNCTRMVLIFKLKKSHPCLAHDLRILNRHPCMQSFVIEYTN